MKYFSCATCAGFNRDEPVQPEVTHGDQVFPAEAHCRRTPPPWATVKATDWCMGWMRRSAQRRPPTEADGS